MTKSIRIQHVSQEDMSNSINIQHVSQEDISFVFVLGGRHKTGQEPRRSYQNPHLDPKCHLNFNVSP